MQSRNKRHNVNQDETIAIYYIFILPMFGAVYVFDLKCLIILKDKIVTGLLKNSVVDLDPYVLEPPGSGFGSVCHKYESGSGSGPFHHQAKSK